MIGNGVGASMGFYFDIGGIMNTIYVVVTCLVACTVVTAVVARANPYVYTLRRSDWSDRETSLCRNIANVFLKFKEPFASRDFTWLFWSRVCMGMGKCSPLSGFCGSEIDN